MRNRHIFFPFQLLCYFVKPTTRCHFAMTVSLPLNTHTILLDLCDFFFACMFQVFNQILLLLHWNQCISWQFFKQPGPLKFWVLISFVCFVFLVGCFFLNFLGIIKFQDMTPIGSHWGLYSWGKEGEIKTKFFYRAYQELVLGHVIFLLESRWCFFCSEWYFH